MFKKVLNQSANEPVVISMDEFQGKMRFDIRHYFRADGGELKPTTKGINVVVTDAPAIIQAIKSVKADGKKVKPAISGYSPIIVSHNEFRGAFRLDVRHYWLPKGTDTLAPTQKGVSVPWDQVALLIDILDEVTTLLSANQVEPEDDILKVKVVVKEGRFAGVEL